MTMHPSADLVRQAESFAEICICTATRMLHGCPRHSPGDAATPQSIHAMLIRILENQEKIMTAQDDINAAVATMTQIATDLGTQAAAIAAAQAAFAAEIATLTAAGVDTSKLAAINTQLAAAQPSLDSAVAALTAASTAGTTPPPAAPAEPVAAGDSGTAS